MTEQIIGNPQPVEMADRKMQMGSIDDIERRATNGIQKVQEMNGNIQQAEQRSPASDAAIVGGDLAMRAAGLDMVGALVQFADVRRQDAAGSGGTSPTRTIDDDIQSALRAPGAYRARGGDAEFANLGSAQGTYAAQSPRKMDSSDVAARANIFGGALQTAEGDCVGTWKNIPSAKTMENVQQARQLAITNEITSKQALDSTIVARQEQTQDLAAQREKQLAHGQRMGMPGMGMGLGMDLMMRPRGPSGIEAEEAPTNWGGTQTQQ